MATPRSLIVFKVYQLTTHRVLGFYTGEMESVKMFCSLKYNVESDDIAIEKIPAKRVTRDEVMCFRELIGQLRSYTDRIRQLEDEADEAGVRDDLLEILQSIETYV